MRTVKDNPYGREYFESALAKQVDNSQRNRNRLALLRSVVPGGRLLEIGCGKGELLRLALKHYQVEGIDISDYAVRSLRGIKGARVRRANLEVDPLPKQQYELAAAFNVLEHLKQPETGLARLSAALRPGGALVGSVPFNARLLGRAHTLLSNIVDRTHVSTFGPARWMALMQAAGFQQVRFFGEVMLGKNVCAYLSGPLWQWAAFNLMFVARKAPDA